MNTHTEPDNKNIQSIHEIARNLAAMLDAGATIPEISIHAIRFLDSKFPNARDRNGGSALEELLAEECGELALFLVLESERLGFDFTREMATELGDYIFETMFPESLG